MDTKKTGAFIAKKRKEKNMTQEQLGEKLGVSNKTISRWENGNYMPDIGLLIPLSEILEISLNELLEGESIEKEKIALLAEKNIADTITYISENINIQKKRRAVILAVVGFVIFCSGMSVVGGESIWNTICALVGMLMISAGLFMVMNRKYKTWKRILISLTVFLMFFICAYGVDFSAVAKNGRPPIFKYAVEKTDVTVYRSFFYDVYRINENTQNEYYITDIENRYTANTVPKSPFRRDLCGIDVILKYASPYVGNGSNTSGLVNSLPLSEKGAPVKIDSKTPGLTISYGMPDWYEIEEMYIKKALIYNSAAIFALIDNVEYIRFDFVGSSYRTDRKTFEKNYPEWEKIKEGDKLDTTAFDKYIESRLNKEKFAEKVFDFCISPV